MGKLLVAVGTEHEWRRYSTPKTTRTSYDSPFVLAGDIVIELQDVEWNVKKDCTLTYVHLLDGDTEETLITGPLDNPVSLRRGDLFTLLNVRLSVYTSYNGPCLV